MGAICLLTAPGSMLKERNSPISFYLFELEQNVKKTLVSVYPESQIGEKAKGGFLLFILKQKV